MKKIVILALLCVLLCACTPSAPSSTPADASPTPESAAPVVAATPSASPEPVSSPDSSPMVPATPEPQRQMEVTGAIVSFAADQIEIRTPDGRVLAFATADVGKADIGEMLYGATLTVGYTGQITGEDTSAAQAVAIEQNPEEKHATGTIALFDGREMSLQLAGDDYIQFSIEGADLAMAPELEIGKEATVFYIGDEEVKTVVRLVQGDGAE